MVTCYEAATGKEVYRERVGGTSYTASPVAADGRLYFTSEQGEVRVVKAGPEFELLAVNKMGEVVHGDAGDLRRGAVRPNQGRTRCRRPQVALYASGTYEHRGRDEHFAHHPPTIPGSNRAGGGYW